MTDMSRIQAMVDATYVLTRERLADDPEYQRLLAAAQMEEALMPHRFLERNRLAMYVEVRTPLPDPYEIRRAEAERLARDKPRRQFMRRFRAWLAR